MDVKIILVGVDFSEGSRSAYHFAAELASRFEARLVLVHVVNGHDVRLMATVTGEDEAGLLSRLRREATERLEAFLAAEGAEAEILVTAGMPYHQIALKARELAADLIVMGGQGMSRDRMAEALFGSTAERVVRLLPCPVLCVPAEV